MKTFSEFLEARIIKTGALPAAAILAGLGTAINELTPPATPEQITQALEQAIEQNKPENRKQSSDSKPSNPGTSLPVPPPVPIPKDKLKRRKRNENK